MLWLILLLASILFLYFGYRAYQPEISGEARIAAGLIIAFFTFVGFCATISNTISDSAKATVFYETHRDGVITATDMVQIAATVDTILAYNIEISEYAGIQRFDWLWWPAVVYPTTPLIAIKQSTPVQSGE